VCTLCDARVRSGEARREENKEGAEEGKATTRRPMRETLGWRSGERDKAILKATRGIFQEAHERVHEASGDASLAPFICKLGALNIPENIAIRH
jgi:hypothetical protein